VANAIELFHNFSLVHDDIMDNAPLRRGTPTIHVQYNMPTAILAGDVLCIYAYRQLAHIGNPQHLKAIYPVFNETAIQVCEGQQMDMDFEAQPNTTLSDYITMITLKTSVLLACALKIGALLGGSLAYNAQKLYEFGKCLGIAFQLQDDYLDSFGAMELTGKKTGGDINANKKTYLLTHALNHANSAQLDTLKSLHPQTGEEKINHITHLFRQTGADTACLAEVKQYTATALQALEQVAIPAARKATLFQFANMLLNREG
ncbi:MAG: polyprenyl synthetase family protein, partial [Chitinophagia bacterium]|nr:polyprenyl synthetase family protein [Chitinophagia bacterium]